MIENIPTQKDVVQVFLDILDKIEDDDPLIHMTWEGEDKIKEKIKKRNAA